MPPATALGDEAGWASAARGSASMAAVQLSMGGVGGVSVLCSCWEALTPFCLSLPLPLPNWHKTEHTLLRGLRLDHLLRYFCASLILRFAVSLHRRIVIPLFRCFVVPSLHRLIVSSTQHSSRTLFLLAPRLTGYSTRSHKHTRAI